LQPPIHPQDRQPQPQPQPPIDPPLSQSIASETASTSTVSGISSRWRPNERSEVDLSSTVTSYSLNGAHALQPRPNSPCESASESEDDAIMVPAL
ncbi:hypothetical protein BGZ65_000767, partial [Modicella reniformis]